MICLFAKDIMQRNVAFVRENVPVSDCINILVNRHISGLPVVDAARQLVGIVSQTDLLRHGGHRQDCRLVRDVMSRQVVYADSDTPLHSLAEAMLSRHIHRLLVTSASRVVGIVTSMDVASVLLRQKTALKHMAEFRREYSRIYSNKHEKLVLRLEHIEQMKAMVKQHASKRGQEGGEPLSMSDIVNSCLDFIFESPIDLCGVGNPENLRDIVAAEVCARLASDLRTEPILSVNDPAIPGIMITRAAPCRPPSSGSDAIGRAKNDDGTWPPRGPSSQSRLMPRETLQRA
jgi:CBS domain-containing protein